MATLSFLFLRQMGSMHRNEKKYASSAALKKLNPVQRPIRPPNEAGSREKNLHIHLCIFYLVESRIPYPKCSPKRTIHPYDIWTLSCLCSKREPKTDLPLWRSLNENKQANNPNTRLNIPKNTPSFLPGKSLLRLNFLDQLTGLIRKFSHGLSGWIMGSGTSWWAIADSPTFQ